MNEFHHEYDLLFKTCELIAKYKKIKFIKPSSVIEAKNYFEYIEQIAATSHLRVRKVSLENDWWRKDGGVLLAFFDERPCALLPIKTGGYQLIDLQKNHRITVNEKIATQISKNAFYFYGYLPKNIDKLSNLFRFSLGPIKSEVGILLGVQCLLSLLILLIPLIFGYIFNQVIPSREISLLWQIVALLIIGIIVFALFSGFQSLTLVRLRLRMESNTMPEIWDHILKLPLRFFREVSAGDIIFRSRVVNNAQARLIDSFLLLMGHSLSSFLLLLLMFHYSPPLASVALVLALLMTIIFIAINQQQLQLMRRLYNQFERFIEFVFEIIHGIIKIRVANAVGRVFSLWMAELAKGSKTEFVIKSKQSKLETFKAFMVLIIPFVLYGLVPKFAKQLSFGTFIAFNIAYILFFLTVIKISQSWIQFAGITPLWKKSQKLLTAPVEFEKGDLNPGELNGNIVLKNIFFGYHHHEAPLFRDFSLAVQPGEFIAIVGPSGSGKSTLFRLMLGFERPESGEIFYNGLNLENLRLTALRKQIGVVIQNSTLIPGTILENIAGSSLQMTRIEAWEIAEKVGLAEFIKYLPMQMDTLITEGPLTLSGGEAQRLILARALAQRPKILFLDEATSALDNTTQAVVQNYLKQLHATQIIAAHRLSTIVNADRIIVLEKGVIVQSGTFTELMNQPGLFAQMAKRQL